MTFSGKKRIKTHKVDASRSEIGEMVGKEMKFFLHFASLKEINQRRKENIDNCGNGS